VKFYDDVPVPAHTRRVILRIDCDFCGDTIEERGKERPTVFTDRVYITRSVGSLSGPFGHDSSVDMCGCCFTTKFVPWLEEQGVKLAVTTWGDDVQR
jgi:hypothetical protein